MKNRKSLKALVVMAIASCMAWGCGPQTLEPSAPVAKSGILKGELSSLGSASASGEESLRKVLVHDILKGSQHWFLDVQEINGKRYWIATSPEAYQVGGTYAFTKGYGEVDFQSDELERSFDELFWVDQVKPAALQGAAHQTDQTSHQQSTDPVTLAQGSQRIADVIDKSSILAGQQVQVTGRVTKVNPDIMDRHWIHLQDGSRDDFDFVVTSEMSVPLGKVVTLAGKLSIDRDFGAGYRYDVILENGQIIP
ncbi:MAG: hypothetical protein ACPGYK_03970 [Flavobacteriales bacterium]